MTSSVEKTTPSAARTAYETLEPFHVLLRDVRVGVEHREGQQRDG